MSPADPAAAVASLHVVAAPNGPDSWLYPRRGARRRAPVFYAWLERNITEFLSAWPPDEVFAIDRALVFRPQIRLNLEITGRLPGRVEATALTLLLLEHGGVAVDDYSAHCWTLPQIEAGTVIGGVAFFNPTAA